MGVRTARGARATAHGASLAPPDDDDPQGTAPAVTVVDHPAPAARPPAADNGQPACPTPRRCTGWAAEPGGRYGAAR